MAPSANPDIAKTFLEKVAFPLSYEGMEHQVWIRTTHKLGLKIRRSVMEYLLHMPASHTAFFLIELHWCYSYYIISGPV
jgi:hypothetical protein